jgi:signal transduction histidine kinase
MIGNNMNECMIKDQFFNPSELLNTIMDSFDHGIMFIDREYNILFLNKEKRDNNPNISPGMKCFEVFEEYGMRCPFCIANKAMEEGIPQRNKDYISIQKGVEFPVHLNITVYPIKDEEGKVIGAVEIAYDVENIYQTNIRLERLNKEYEHVIYALSHDLRAPLVSIEGFVKKLTNNHIDRTNAEAMRCVERIHVNVHSMNNLVKVLLDKSRIATGKLEIQEVDMDYLVRALVSEILSAVSGKKVRFIIDMKTTTTRCDKIRVQQIFTNLIKNSIDHSKESKDLVIEIGSDKSIFRVKDNGPGIPASFINKVYDAFTQGAESGSNHEHFGMGMNIVYKIVEKHGGRTWIESEEGKGTTVFFTLQPNI